MRSLQTFLVGFLILATVGVSSCNLTEHSTNATTNSPSGSNEPPAKSGASTASSGDDASVVRNAFEQLNKRPFRLREDSNMGGASAEQTVTRVVEVIPPDRRHAVLGDLETITIGNQRYTKSNGSWTKATTTLRAETGDIIREAFHKAVVDGSLKIQHAGTDTLAGQPEDVYSMAGSVQLKETTIKGYTTKVWVTKSDGLLRKTESTYEGKPWKSVVTYEYPPNITIDAPIP